MSWSPGGSLLQQPSLTFLLLLLAATCACGQGRVVQPETRLGCHIRVFYKDVVIEPHVTESGEVIECSGKVRIHVCYGHCESVEVGDYKMPYKIARHHVCSYGGHEMRRMRLECPGHPKPFAHVLQALSCMCQVCNPEDTSCQQLIG